MSFFNRLWTHSLGGLHFLIHSFCIIPTAISHVSLKRAGRHVIASTDSVGDFQLAVRLSFTAYFMCVIEFSSGFFPPVPTLFASTLRLLGKAALGFPEGKYFQPYHPFFSSEVALHSSEMLLVFLAPVSRNRRDFDVSLSGHVCVLEDKPSSLHERKAQGPYFSVLFQESLLCLQTNRWPCSDLYFLRYSMFIISEDWPPLEASACVIS